MCGIAGIFDKKGVSHQTLHSMSRIMRHRGPDDEGYVTFDTNNNHSIVYRGDDTVPELIAYPHISQTVDSEDIQLGLLHRRLSIIDLSIAGHQPLYFADHRCTLVFNGEIYNYLEIKKTLEGLGHRFSSVSDTEVLLAAYYEWGKLCVQYFVGMWAFAIWDSRNRNIFLSRDRFGIKPLYFSQRNGKFSFASEIKALLIDSTVCRKVHYDNMSYYLYFNNATSNESTLFADIQQVPAGHNGFYDINNEIFKLEQYYHLEHAVAKFSNTFNGDPFENYSIYFQDAIDLHLRSDVEIGSCLSGGLDSSGIIAFVAPRMKGATYKTFTAAYQNPKIDESYFAKAVGTNFSNIKQYFTYPSAGDFWDIFDKLAWHQDLPIQTTSIFAQWMVMKLASEQKMKVLLDGQGADESLGGYDYFLGVYLLNLLKNFRGYTFINEFQHLKKNRHMNILTELARASLNYLPVSFRKRLKENFRISSSFLSEDFRQQFLPENFHVGIGKTLRERCIYSMGDPLQILLRYEDRNSMAFSIESRVPFLDHRLVEFTLSMRDQYKINKGWTKYLLRKSVEKKLPSEVVWRKDKKGFITPQNEWIKQSNAQLLELIEDTELPDFFIKDEMRKLLLNDFSNEALLDEFWKLVGLIKWFQVFDVEF